MFAAFPKRRRLPQHAAIADADGGVSKLATGDSTELAQDGTMNLQLTRNEIPSL
jgi:hypothetical protein